MTLRNTSAKFSLPFGRKPSAGPTGSAEDPTSPSRSRNASGNYGSDTELQSPTLGTRGDGHGSAGFDGLGKKIGKSLAHTSLLPGLGNKDLRALQDVIAAEKGVLQAVEKLGAGVYGGASSKVRVAELILQETSNVATKLPTYGAQEGPDLQDVLTHSSTLLNHMATALHVFASHETNLRAAYKRIRDREEELEELRRRRRATGQKAETAEKKLAKMGPENKGLPQQTELLERLRGEMRSMDTDIVNEESKVGDYKRQVVKEALSYKFGGLEELGEKLCILGELGKLLLEEIPLEETPPGYGRAPYTAYERTENTINEASKCLATVQFHAGSAAPKPPGLPHLDAAGSLRAPSIPRHSRSVSDAEEFAHYPRNASSPPAAPYGLDQNPYIPHGDGGASVGAQLSEPHDSAAVFWQGPNDDGHGHDDHAYEYEQQRSIDAVSAQKLAASPTADDPTMSIIPAETDGAHVGGLAPAADIHATSITDRALAHEASIVARPWDPLNVRRTPEPPASYRLHDGEDLQADEATVMPTALGQPLGIVDAHDAYDAIEADPAPRVISAALPPPSVTAATHGSSITPGESDFYTPAEEPSGPMSPTGSASIVSFPLPDSTTKGTMSAAAFRRGVKPRTSTESADHGSAPLVPPNASYDRASSSSPTQSSHQIRRLPVPPIDADARAASPTPSREHGPPVDPPPVYAEERDSLR